MAWTPKGTLYLPPQKPVAKVISTDEYVQGTGYYFQAGTERLLIVGHPYFDIYDPTNDKKIVVPKVSANQYRVLRMKLPDPNKFAIPDPCFYNPDKERLVWRLVGLQVDRGGPLGIGATGHPYFNRYYDTENPSVYPPKQGDNVDSRQDVACDPKQVQMLIVGCNPAIGQYWDTTKFCDDHRPSPGACPAIELMHTVIQDGDMCEIGFGNANFEAFNHDRAAVPLELTNETCIWPDFVKMTKAVYGDELFFCSKREQMYARHYFCRAGIDGDTLPTHSYWNPDSGQDYPQKDLGPYCYYTTPSGSLVSSDTNIFNRPYWMYKASGANNGVLWGNQCFITIVDNTRNVNFNLSVYKDDTPPSQSTYKYNAKDFRNYLRHPEEFEVELILEMCKVPLEADIITHLNVMNPRILEDWDLAFIPPPPEGLQDSYRYIASLATKCPADVEPVEKKDPWEKYSFWQIDLSDKVTAELSQTPLGKRFLYQNGLINNRKIKNSFQSAACKRCSDAETRKQTVKRRRRN